MKAPNPKQPGRPQLIIKMQKVLKSHYKPIAPNTNRSVLEQVLFACCLENAPYDSAEKAFARLSESYFDLNEVRVTTVAELAESLVELPDPPRAALALRRVLQGVFESTYSFSLEHAKKYSIAHGIKTLEHLHGIPPFVTAFVSSTALGGHYVPLDLGAISALYLTGIVTQQEYDAQKVLGIERLVSKKAGQEFGSVLHQFGADCVRNLHGSAVKKLLQAINPAEKTRFPKRGEPLAAPNPPPQTPSRENQKATEAAQAAADELRPAGPQAAARPPGKTPLPPPGSGPKRTADGKPIVGGKTGPKPFVVKPNMGKPPAVKQPAVLPVSEKSAPVKGRGAPLRGEAGGTARLPKAAVPKRPVTKSANANTSGTPKRGAPKDRNKPKKSGNKIGPGKLKPAEKSSAKRHSIQLAKRKPR
ncbi:MAG: hypothetical protein NT089_10150 [Planctomycetia bacterium]|nr:hypothetical protein [Planctomycetia bacterium]